jgi:hypothetical protein
MAADKLGTVWRTWKPLVFVCAGLAVFSIVATLLGLSWQPEPRLDDLDKLVRRFGRPDYDTSTANDSPRPMFVTRTLTYERARVRAVYRTDGGANRLGVWVLIGYLDSGTDSRISEQFALNRLTQATAPAATAPRP